MTSKTTSKMARENVEIMTRQGLLPSRDMLLAVDQFANLRETIDSINKDIDHMRATCPMAQRQAD